MVSSFLIPLFVLSSLVMVSEGFSATKSPKAGGFGSKKVDPMSPHSLDNSKETLNLVEFINKNGGVCNRKAKIASVKNTMRGLVCTTSAIKKGEVICSLPSTIALALSDPNVGDVDVVEGASTYLDWYVNNQERSEYFEPYMSSLPKVTDGKDKFQVTPSFFEMEEIAEMEEGQEVTIGYGSGGFSSLDLFGEHGFVDPMDKMELDEKNVKKGPLQRKPVTPDERMMAKEEEKIKGKWDGWRTTLQEDVKELMDTEPGSNMARILEFRIKLKRAGGWV
ncbi:hypothetical protein TrRE_jg4673 [Triparma retinervis]|uniref:Uncharacterized protein n=1 Tax=Triparma retinervis TaxID=2557542 RepID=A0A9W7E6N9_9STRA|nr:hypothetical protein TrRE_jg4673 [Triparma retinervis]